MTAMATVTGEHFSHWVTGLAPQELRARCGLARCLESFLVGTKLHLIAQCKCPLYMQTTGVLHSYLVMWGCRLTVILVFAKKSF